MRRTCAMVFFLAAVLLGRPVGAEAPSLDRASQPEQRLAGCTDADGDGFCLGTDCNDFNPFCTTDCTDADQDGFCVGHDCDESNPTCTTECGDLDGDGVDGCLDCDDSIAACTTDCTDADSDGLAACAGDCDDLNPSCTTDCSDPNGDGICFPNTFCPALGVPAPLNSNAGVDAGEDSHVDLARDDNGNWVAVWSSEDDLGGTVGTDTDILFSTSADDGLTWSGPAALHAYASTDSYLDVDPVVATDGVGTWLAVWVSTSEGGSDLDIVFARSMDDGLTWSGPAPVNARATTDNGAGSPCDERVGVAASSSGTWIVQWAEGAVFCDEFYSLKSARSTDAGLSWTEQLVPGAGPHVQPPELATDSAGSWISVWPQRSPDFPLPIRYARSLDDGASWEPVQLSGIDGYSPTVACDGTGQWLIAASAGPLFETPDIQFVRSVNNGLTWSAPASVDADPGRNDQEPDLATDGTGSWVVVWRGNGLQTLAASSTDVGATWTAPALLNPGAVAVTATARPRLIGDDLGRWLVAWTDTDTLGGTVGADRDLFVMEFDSSCVDCDGDGYGFPGSVSCAAGALPDCDNGNPGCATDCTDPDGDGFCVTSDCDETNANCGPDCTDSDGDGTCDPMDCDPVDPACTTDCTDADADGVPACAGDCDDLNAGCSLDCSACHACWELDTAVAINNDAELDLGLDNGLSLATDGAGTWIAVWSSTNFGNDLDVVYARSFDDGATWSAPTPMTLGFLSDSQTDYGPTIAYDGAGLWLVAWSSTESLGGTLGGDTDLFLSRSTNAGFTWTVPAVLDPAASSDGNVIDLGVRLASDGQGNWLAVWPNSRFGNDLDIVVSRSSDDGATWTTSQPLNSDALTDSVADNLPGVATDGAGNWHAVWVRSDQLFYSRSMDNGATWSPEQPQPATGDPMWGLTLGCDGSNLVAAWAERDPSFEWDIFVTTSDDGGSSWTPAAAIDPPALIDGAEDREPRLASESGTWIAAWSRKPAGDTVPREMRIARSTDGGLSWTESEAITPPTGERVGGVALATDGAGRGILGWARLSPDWDAFGIGFSISGISTCLDCDGDGYGFPGHPSCPGGGEPDCDALDATMSPGAPEINDGLDNQCPGSPGAGLVDETSGDSGFHTAGNEDRYSWTPQAGATLYEVARATSPDFATDCMVIPTFANPWLDDFEVPASGGAFHYLNRAIAPNPGDWGQDSSGAARTGICP